MLRTLILTSVAATALLAAGQANSDPRIVNGTLDCSIAAGQSFVLGSNRAIDCLYTAASGASERYRGEIARFGVDIGFLNRGRMIWAVLAATDGAPGALAGSYVGAGAGVTPGVGAGAYALTGSGSRAVTLQPFSVEGNTGINVAVGVAELRLRPAQ